MMAAGGHTIQFDALHKAVHYPPDRRFRIWIKPSFVAGVVGLLLLPFLIAWAEVVIFRLPYIPPVPQFNEASAAGPHGFPFWVRYAHFFNFLFLIDAHTERPFNSHGSSAALSEQRLHPGH